MSLDHPQPFSAAEWRQMIAHHREGRCYYCRELWPCTEARLLATLEAALEADEREAARLRAAAQALWALRDADQHDQRQVRALYNAWQALGAALAAMQRIEDGQP